MEENEEETMLRQAMLGGAMPDQLDNQVDGTLEGQQQKHRQLEVKTKNAEYSPWWAEARRVNAGCRSGPLHV